MLGLARTLDHDKTPYDIAFDGRHAHLLDILRPVVRRPVSALVLRDLEVLLHVLIRRNMVELDSFVLPRLEPLAEFDSATMWFPSSPEQRKASSMGVDIAMLTHLHQIELEVKFKWKEFFTYRISADGVRRVIR